MKRKYSDGIIYVKYDMTHCAIMINNMLYDANGIVDDQDNYHQASIEEIETYKRLCNPQYRCLNIKKDINEFLRNNI